MIVYEEIVIKTKVDNHKKAIENLQYRLENAKDEMNEMLCKAALEREYIRLEETKGKLSN